MSRSMIRYFMYGAVFVLIIFSLYYINFDGSQSGRQSQGSSQSIIQDNGLTGTRGETYVPGLTADATDKERIMSIFDDPNMLDFHTLMEYVRKGKINLVRELWRLRRKCPANLLSEQCDKKILLFISERFPYPQNKRMVDLVQKYFQYEKAVRNLKQIRTMKPQERYEMLMQKRREIFGEQDAQLVFGLQEAKYSFGKSYREFLQQTKDMSGKDRMQAYEQMRRRVYGEYYDEVVKKEPKFDKYRTELTLRKNEMSKLDDSQKNIQIKSIREQYFGKEAAKRMEQVDKAYAQRKQNEQKYIAQEKKFLEDNPNLSDSERKKQLRQLRVNIFGSEAKADMFERRQAMREYLRKKQLQK